MLKRGFAHSLHDDSHVHVAVVGAAEVITDGCEAPSVMRRHREFDRLSRGNLLVKLQRSQEESMCDILAVNAKLNRLIFLQRDFVRTERETLGCNLYDGNVVRLHATCAAEQQQ